MLQSFVENSATFYNHEFQNVNRPLPETSTAENATTNIDFSAKLSTTTTTKKTNKKENLRVLMWFVTFEIIIYNLDDIRTAERVLSKILGQFLHKRFI